MFGNFYFLVMIYGFDIKSKFFKVQILYSVCLQFMILLVILIFLLLIIIFYCSGLSIDELSRKKLDLTAEELTEEKALAYSWLS